MNFLFLLLVAAAVFCFFKFFNFKETPSPNKTAQQTQEIKNSTPVTKPEPVPASKTEIQPDDSTVYQKGSLGEYLEEMHKKKYSLAFSFDLKKISAKRIYEIKQKLNKAKTQLQFARDLKKYNELGLNKKMIKFETPVPHSQYFSGIERLLICSGFVNAADCNIADALEDFQTAIKILNIYLNGTYCSIDLYYTSNIRNHMITVIKNSNLPDKDKQSFLDMIPGHKEFSQALPQICEGDLQLCIGLKQYLEKTSGKLAGFSAETLETVRETPMPRFEKLLTEYYSKLVQAFSDGSLKKESKFDIGTPKENAMLAELISIPAMFRVYNAVK